MEDKSKQTPVHGFEVITSGKMLGHSIKAKLVEGPAGRPLAQIKVNHPDQENSPGNFSMAALQELISHLQFLEKRMKEQNKQLENQKAKVPT